MNRNDDVNLADLPVKFVTRRIHHGILKIPLRDKTMHQMRPLLHVGATKGSLFSNLEYRSRVGPTVYSKSLSAWFSHISFEQDSPHV